MFDDVKFRVDKKKLLLTTIQLLRERGGTYSEIAKVLNEKEMFTPNGKEWSNAYLFRFYTENKIEKAQ